VVVAGEFAAVVAVVERILDEKPAFLAEGKLVALKLCAVPPHIVVEPAVDVGVAEVDRNWDIAVLVAGRLVEGLAFEVLAYVVADRAGVVAYWVHCEGYR
jgi:hypothetical protein